MRQEIIGVLRGVLPPGFTGEILVSVPDVSEHGDYSTNVAFVLAKAEGRAPREVAEEIVAKIKDQGLRIKGKIFSRVEVAGGGFINFWIAEDVLVREAFRPFAPTKRKTRRRGGSSSASLRIKIEYFQPNVAKILHVGHMRTAIIGDALKRIFLWQGHKVISDTHIGDWGTQFGILLYGWKQLSEAERGEIRKNPLRGLNNLYVEESKRIDSNPERREKGKEEFVKLERGDRENRKIWEWMLKVSVREFERVKKELGLLKFEDERGESVYEDAMPPLVARALKGGVAIKKDEAVVVDLEDVGFGDAVLLKSDGASTYLLRDLATLEYLNKKKLDKNLYVVDIRQARHFEQVFEVGKRLGILLAERSEHIVYGFVSLPGRAMSTRKGDVVWFWEVFEEVVSRAREVIEEKNPELKNKDKVAKAVGIGALKYFDLAHHPKSNIVFDKEKALAFEGNTGPYLQYTYARLRSILRKTRNPKPETRNKFKIQNVQILNTERLLLVEIARFSEAVEDAAKAYAPSLLANYLYGLAGKANEFYHAVPVLKEEDAEKRGFRLALVGAVAETLKRGLYLLGIEAPEEM